MKLRKKEFDVFNLSFLDVISCGFGAVIILVLISKTHDDVSIIGKGEVESLLTTVISLENEIVDLQQTVDSQLSEADRSTNEKKRLEAETIEIAHKIQQQKTTHSSLSDSVQGLSLVQSTLKQASITTKKITHTVRDEEVGGIPVDSDYIIFIVDTSGSMRQIWGRVSTEIINVLNIHPKVKGFQILNDMGKPLISGYDGKWIPDTPKRRSSVIKLFHNWGAVSNSSPIEGIQVALLKYAKPNITTSIYVFGDDYTGSSYDPVINKITKKNLVASTGKRLARIHGIGFISSGTTNRYSILMRELTKQNGGAFLALPL
ncbi:MAG: hypothetical protein COA83_11620 [Methylophaga sp.]|nr:MAG: hypothetical protein COA83_11620 [Methylophaga sp.]